MYLLDTNVISQLTRRQPNPGIVVFMNKIRDDEAQVYLSALTIGEIGKGIVKLTRYWDHRQAKKLQQWLTQIRCDYSDKILPIDTDTIEIWGAILAATDDTNAVDKLIAATALQYDLTVVTRNIDHMAGTGAKCVNPFSRDEER